MTTEAAKATAATSLAHQFAPRLTTRCRAVLTAAGAAGLMLSLASVTFAGGPALAAAPQASFQRAVNLSPPLASSSTPYAYADSVSCTSLGNCVVGGDYRDRAGLYRPMVITEQSGKWHRGVTLRLPNDAPSAVESTIYGVSCPRAGLCTAVGDYPAVNVGLGRVFAAAEIGGRWRQARELRLPSNAAWPPAGQVNAVACTAPGSCEAVGEYVDNVGHTQGMVVTERSGNWSRASEVLPLGDAAANPYAELVTVACPAAGQCVIAGDYTDIAGKPVALGLVHAHGTWETVTEIKLPSNADRNWLDIRSVSCRSSRCVIVGNYTLNATKAVPMSATAVGGDISAFTQVKAVPPGYADGSLNGLSCIPTGQCVAVGYYTDGADHYHAYTVVRSATGHWANAANVPAPRGASSSPGLTADLDGISCVSGGCTAAGFYMTSSVAQDVMAAVRR